MLKFIIFLGFLFHLEICGGERGENAFTLFTTRFFSLSLDGIGANCRRDFLEYIEGVLKGEIWALRMVDSMEKFPAGLLTGRITAPGHFEGCLDVVHPNFTGKHCMVDLLQKNSEYSEETLNSTFAEDRNFNIFRRLWKRVFAYGVCIPSTCNASDLNAIMGKVGVNEFFFSDVRDIDCSTTADTELRVKDYLAIAFLLFMLLLVLVSTAYDMYYAESKEGQSKVLKSFSLHYNWKLLFHTSTKSSEMDSLNGIRFLSMVWVLLGHYIFIEYIFGDVWNNIDKFEIRNKISAIPLTNAFPSVDSFFFLSGLLVCFVFFRDISVQGYYDAPVALLRRYIRLTGPFALMVLIDFTLFSRIVSGPLMRQTLEEMEESCKTYWWTYFLYIHNFYTDARKCVAPGWYLGADMQMFLVSPLVVYVLLLRPKFALKYLGLLIFGSSLTSFIMSYKNNLAPNYLADYYSGNKHLEYFYFYTRFSPWVVGVATGYILCGIKAKKISFKLKKVWVAVGWLTAAFLCLSSLYGIAAFIPFETSHSAVSRALYRSLHRLGWALGLAWIVLACVGGYGGPVNSLLSISSFQPLAKLSYSIYLVHVSVQRYRYYQVTRHSNYSDYSAMVVGLAADLVLSTIVSIPVTLMFEMPFIHLGKIFLQNLQIFPYPKPPEKLQLKLENGEKPKQIDLEKGPQIK